MGITVQGKCSVWIICDHLLSKGTKVPTDIGKHPSNPTERDVTKMKKKKGRKEERTGKTTSVEREFALQEMFFV